MPRWEEFLAVKTAMAGSAGTGGGKRVHACEEATGPGVLPRRGYRVVLNEASLASSSLGSTSG